MDYINKYRLIINAGEQTVSVTDNNKQVTLKLELDNSNIRYPARLLNNTRIPPKRTVSVPLSVGSLSANMLFGPSFKL
jgi:hypothetical protein